jgi:hypothetical protein
MARKKGLYNVVDGVLGQMGKPDVHSTVNHDGCIASTILRRRQHACVLSDFPICPSTHQLHHTVPLPGVFRFPRDDVTLDQGLSTRAVPSSKVDRVRITTYLIH